VLVCGGRIAAVGNRAAVQIPGDVETIDCSGLTITAGFWNSHVHFFERKWTNAAAIPAPELGKRLQEMLTQYGFTNASDLASPWTNTRQIRDRIESGEVRGPRIRSTGEALVAPGAVPAERFGASRQLGRVAVGFISDLTVVNGDPSSDIRALAAVRYTLRDGNAIYRSQ
jgi:imidazolonepropionase-like amidohydrolase